MTPSKNAFNLGYFATYSILFPTLKDADTIKPIKLDTVIANKIDTILIPLVFDFRPIALADE